jgi:alpha-amylase
MLGNGQDILLQGFHWKSHRGSREATGAVKPWWRIVRDNAPSIRRAGFTHVWLPPCTDSLAPQGYIPRRWYDFHSAYGNLAELKEALHALGPVAALADIVVNHRVGVHTSGADFEDPPFADNAAAICSDDESGAGTGAPDTGERHPCGRDLDHTNPDVRHAIKAFLARLQGVGFRGWRWDLVKGFAGRYVGEYVEASGGLFSVGECFESNRQVVADWIDSTGGRCAAFDFPTRYRLYDALVHNHFGGLCDFSGERPRAGGLMGLWPTMAVTFVDNHDTEYTREHEHEANYDATRHFPGRWVDTAYAYTLTHPGVPCVFWQHFFDWGGETRLLLENLMNLRRAAGVHSGSRLTIHRAEAGLYAAEIEGRVAVRLGERMWSPGYGWHEEVSGERFTVWSR